MASIAEIRSSWGPEYAGMSDMEVARHLATQTQTPLPKVLYDFGLDGPNNPSGFTGEAANAFRRSLGQGVQGLGQIADDLGWDNNPVTRYGQDVIDHNPTNINSLEDIAAHPLAALGSGVGNAAGFMVPAGVIGKAGKLYGLGRGAMLGAQTVNAGIPSYGGIREQQLREGHDSPIDMLSAGAGALAVGAIENLGGLQSRGWGARLLGIEKQLDDPVRAAVHGMGDTPWRTAGKELWRSTWQEGAEELAQNPIEQMAAYHDPTTNEAIKETLFGGAMGALGGLGLGGLGAAQAGLQHRAIRDDLRQDGYIDPAVNRPTDLLAGLNRRDQVEGELPNWQGHRDAWRTGMPSEADYASFYGQGGTRADPEAEAYFEEQQRARENQLTPEQEAVLSRVMGRRAWTQAENSPFVVGSSPVQQLRQVETQENPLHLGMRYAEPGQTLDMFAGHQGTFAKDRVEAPDEVSPVIDEASRHLFDEQGQPTYAANPETSYPRVVPVNAATTKTAAHIALAEGKISTEQHAEVVSTVDTSPRKWKSAAKTLNEFMSAPAEQTVPPPAPGVSARNPQGLTRANQTAETSVPAVPQETRTFASVQAELAAAQAHRASLKEKGVSDNTTIVKKATKKVTALRAEAKKLRDDAIVQAFTDYYSRGEKITWREMGKQFGVSGGTISNVLTSRGITQDVLNKAFAEDVETKKVSDLEDLPEEDNGDDAGAKRGFGIINSPNSTQVSERALDNNATDEEKAIAKANVRDTAKANEFGKKAGVSNLAKVKKSGPTKTDLEIEARRKAEAEAEQKQHVANAAAAYDEDLQAGDTPFMQLPKLDQERWMDALEDYHNKVISAQELMRLFTEIADGNRRNGQEVHGDTQVAGGTSGNEAVQGTDAQEVGAKQSLESAFAEQWNSIANDRGLPLWDELTESQREHLLSSGADEHAQNRAFDAVVREVKSGKLAGKGQAFDGSVGIAEQQLVDLGLPHVTEGVDHRIGELSDPDAKAEVEIHGDGTSTITYSENLMQDGMDSEKQHFARHEYGHILDKLGAYSRSAMMALKRTVNGVLVGASPVGNEVVAAMRSNPMLARYFAYPFSAKHAHLSVDEAQQELFAQLFSMYAEPEHRAVMQRELPLAHAFIEGVIADESQRVQTAPESRSEKEAQSDYKDQVQRSGNAVAGENSGGRQAGKGTSLSIANAFNSGAGSTAGSVLRTGKDIGQRAGLATMFMHQIRQMYDGKFGGKIKTYYNRVKEISARAKELVEEGRPIMEKWRAMKNPKLLTDALNAATLSGFFGDVSAFHEDNKHAMGVLEEDEATDSSDMAELRRGLLQEHAKAQAAYKALEAADPEAAKLYRQIFNMSRRWLKMEYLTKGKMVRDAMLPHLLESVDAETTKKISAAYADLSLGMTDTMKQVRELVKGNPVAAKLLGEMNKAINDATGGLKELKGPYFPLMRFGDHITVARSTEFKEKQDELEALDKSIREFKESDTTLKALTDAREDLRIEKRMAFGKKGSEERVRTQAAIVKKARENAKAALASLKDKRLESAKLRRELMSMAQSDEHYIVEKHETVGAAEQSEKHYAGRGYNAYSTTAQTYAKQYQGASVGFVNKLEEALKSKVTDDLKGIVGASLQRVFVESLNDSSSLKRLFLNRKGVSGFSQHGERVFGSFVMQGAHRLANLENYVQMQQALDDVVAKGKELNVKADGKGSVNVANELVKRYLLDLDYQETKWQNRFAALNHVWTLGISPAYLMQQVLQTPMIAMPMVAAKFRAGEVSTAFGKAFADAKKIVGEAQKGYGKPFSLDIENLKLPEGERKMLRELFRNGLLDILAEHDVGEVAAGSHAWSKANTVMDYINWPARQVEMMNRLTTALAAYRLASGKMSHEAAYEYAADIVTESQIDYSNDNAPRWMKHNAFTGAKLFAQFKKYQFAMAYTLFMNAKQAFKKGEEGNEARRMIAGVFMTQMLFAGTMGLPIAMPAFALMGMLGGGSGDDWERWYKNWLAAIPGGDVIARGLPTLANIDISRNVGMGQLYNPLPFVRTDKQGKEQFDELWMGMMPPVFGTARRMVDGYDEMRNGRYYDGAAKMTPRWIAGIARATKLENEGMTDKSGLVRIKADEFSGWDKAMQAAGIPLLETQKYYERIGDVTELTKQKDDARKDILRRWVNGEDVSEDRQAFNEKYPSNRITVSDKLKYQSSMRSRQGKIMENGLAETRTNKDILRQITY